MDDTGLVNAFVLIFFICLFPLIISVLLKSERIRELEEIVESYPEKDDIIADLKSKLEPYETNSDYITSAQISEIESKRLEAEAQISKANHKYLELDRLRNDLEKRERELQQLTLQIKYEKAKNSLDRASLSKREKSIQREIENAYNAGYDAGYKDAHDGY